MKAMILAAGYGTRLRPLTDKMPKVLMPVANKPIIARVIEHLKAHGVSGIVVNAHHLHEQLTTYLDSGRPFGLNIEVRVEPEILGTGGGIKNTERFWDHEPFVVINGDILTDIDLTHAYEEHRRSGALVTLVLHDCEPFNQIRVDTLGNVTDIARKSSPGRLAFTGIHVINPELLSFIPPGVFSDVIACYQELIEGGKKRINAVVAKGRYWRDMGTIKSYIEANRELAHHRFVIGSGCQIAPSTALQDWAVIGDRCRLDKGVVLQRSILWEDVKIKPGLRIVDSIITSSNEVHEDVIDSLI
jgi:mannose-1-phosphate guanylyltransferase